MKTGEDFLCAHSLPENKITAISQKRTSGLMKFLIQNMGCRENAMEGNQMRDFLIQNGCQETDGIDEADVIILNTCGFTEANERTNVDIYHKLEKAKSPHARIILTGCLPAINEEIVKELNYTDHIISPRELKSIAKLIEMPPAANNDNHIFLTPPVSFVKSPSNIAAASVKILELLFQIPFIPIPRWLWQIRYLPNDSIPYIRTSIGCMGECAYCSIRKAKGNICSYPLPAIKEKIISCIQNGHTLITLSADDLGAYGQDIQSNIANLLCEILSIGTNFDLVLRNVEPEWVIAYWDSLQPLFETGRIKYLVIPLQSGCNRVLLKMKRKYTVEEFSDIVFKIKKASPNTIIRTHVIEGFPGETTDDFKETYATLKKLPLDHFIVFGYSDRPGANSAKMTDKIREDIIEKRCNKLILLNWFNYMKLHRWLPLRPS